MKDDLPRLSRRELRAMRGPSGAPAWLIPEKFATNPEDFSEQIKKLSSSYKLAKWSLIVCAASACLATGLITGSWVYTLIPIAIIAGISFLIGLIATVNSADL